MPKYVKHSQKPYDGAILRALRVQAGLQSVQFAAELASLSGMKVLAPHMSGYEAGSRFAPDWLIEGASRIFSKHLGQTIDPMLFPEYAARHLSGADVVDPQRLRKTTTYLNKFAPMRRRLIAAGRAA
jgi:hypothetical protein